MSLAFTLAVLNGGGLSAANVQLILGILLAISEVLGADSRVKSNGILSFILIQVRDFLARKRSNTNT
jgi:hypothetical protein